MKLIPKNDARVDVVWTLAIPEFEQGMDAVYIPIDRGLLGWRLLLTRADMIKKLAELDEQGLKKVRTAMSHDWIDLHIMREAGFNCLSAPDYTNLFKMLRAGRIQYISRSVNEIYREIIAEGKGSFMIDPTWAIYYPAPLYFFVDKEKPHVRDAIEKGLRIALKDGSMKMLFNDFYKDTINALKLEDRKILRIEHRYLSDHHPFNDSTLWFDVEKGF